MRILIDATAAMSGGKVYLEHLLPPLLRLAHAHEFIILHNGTLAESVGQPADARVVWQTVGGLSASNRVWIGKAVVKLFWRLLVLPYQLWRWQPDVLFSNAGFAPGWRPRRTRLVLALHNSMPLRAELITEEHSRLHRWRLQLLRRLIARSVRQADATIVFSHDTRERLQACFGPLRYTPSVVYHGIDWHDVTPPDNPRHAVLLPESYLLYVSQFHRYKNLGRLLAAFAEVRARHPQLSLVLIGEAADAQYWQEIETQIDSLGLSDHVYHLPTYERDRLPEVYRNATAFVHPSLAETCSFPLLEALAVGTPVVAARMSALPEIASDAACYFDPYDVADLVRVLDSLLADDALRKDLSARAQKRAQAFTWQEAAEKTLHVLSAAGESHE